MVRKSEKPSSFKVVLQKNYGLYTAGSTISLFGMWAHKLAAAWLAWDLTGSSFWVGAVAFAELVPTLILTPFAGVLAERYDRLRLTTFSQICGLVQSSVLGWMALSGQFSEYRDVYWLVAWSAFLGVVWSVNTAARLSVVPNLVVRDDVPSAVALNSAIFNLARVIGPAMGGWMIAIWGLGEAFLFNAVTYIFFIVALIFVRPVRDDRRPRTGVGIFIQAADGIRYATKHPGIGPMLVLLTAMAIGGKSLLELMPEFADHVFKVGKVGLGYLTATAGAGGLLAAIWLTARGRVEGLTVITISALAVTAVAVFSFVATDWFPLALVSVFLLGVTGICGGTTTQTLMQHAVDESVRGRVMSLYGMIHRGAPALGALLMGAMAELIGIRFAVAVGGFFCVAVWIWLAPRTLEIRNILEADKAIN
ncbi:MAG: MFS transporter [Rhodospirillaceae bacterium]